eukprot:671251-Rhodomonas_salina.1
MERGRAWKGNSQSREKPNGTTNRNRSSTDVIEPVREPESVLLKDVDYLDLQFLKPKPMSDPDVARGV